MNTETTFIARHRTRLIIAVAVLVGAIVILIATEVASVSRANRAASVPASASALVA